MKSFLKSIVRCVAFAAVAPLYFAYLVARLFISRDEAFAGACEWLSLAPGTLGSYLRVAFLRLTLLRCSSNCRIAFGVLFSKVGAEVGHGSYIGPRTTLGLVTLGDDVLVGPSVQLLSGPNTHAFDDLDVPIRDQQHRPRRITIGAGAWIGAGSIIMADVGPQTVVGAGSVVTKPLPPRVVAAGVPARVIRNRDGSPVPCNDQSLTNPNLQRSTAIYAG